MPKINDFTTKCRITGMGGVGGPIATIRTISNVQATTKKEMKSKPEVSK